MNSIELRERLRKSEENVEKIKKTIERHDKQADKKKAIIESNGWTFNRWDYVGGGPIPNDDAYWTICEYEGKLSDIKNAENRLAEAEQIRDNWQAKLDRQLELEKKIQTEIPEVFKQVKVELAEMWTKWDIDSRELMKAKELELREEYKDDREGFSKAWRQFYTYTKEESLRHTDEEFRKMNDREAELWLLELYNRVYAITGKITDCSGIRWGGKCLDGKVIGEAGTAVVTTIDAGGYNVQRYHLRTLVREVKEG